MNVKRAHILDGIVSAIEATATAVGISKPRTKTPNTLLKLLEEIDGDSFETLSQYRNALKEWHSLHLKIEREGLEGRPEIYGPVIEQHLRRNATREKFMKMLDDHGERLAGT